MSAETQVLGLTLELQTLKSALRMCQLWLCIPLG